MKRWIQQKEKRADKKLKDTKDELAKSQLHLRGAIGG